MSSYFLDDLREELRAAATREAAGQRGRRRRIPRRVAVLTLAIAAAAFVGVRAIPEPNLDEIPATRSIDPTLAKHFAILRRPRTAADAIPQRWHGQLPRFAGADGAPAPSVPPDFGAARRASSAASVWIVPGDGGACLFEALGDTAAFGCASTVDAVRGRLRGYTSGSATGLPAGERRVSGLLPDGASRVSIRLRDGTTRPVALHGNVYTVDVPSRPIELAWTDAGGTARTIVFFSQR